MNLCKRLALILPAILFSLLFFLSESKAQEVEFTSSLNPVGSGARATGMGGAFIGVADDATSASWNPAGLVQLEKPEVSVVHQYSHRNQHYSSTVDPEMISDNSMDTDSINYVSLAYPFILFNRNMTVSLNYQRLYELDKESTFNRSRSVFGESHVGTLDFRQEGFLYAIAPAMAVQVSPDFYAGATLNIWDNTFGTNGWETAQTDFVSGIAFGTIPFELTNTTKQKVSFEGINATIGFLWMISDSFTLGGVYKSPFDADLSRTSVEHDIQVFPSETTEVTEVTTENLVLKMPASYGLGLSYRHSDVWTIALDVYRTDWSRTLLRSEEGVETLISDGSSADEGRLKDTTQFRLGTEYLFIREKDVIAFRLGVLYDPEPQKEHLDEYYGFSFGTGYARGRFVLDISYQYRTGNNLTGHIPSFPGSSAEIKQHTLMSSLIFYFSE